MTLTDCSTYTHFVGRDHQAGKGERYLGDPFPGQLRGKLGFRVSASDFEPVSEVSGNGPCRRVGVRGAVGSLLSPAAINFLADPCLHVHVRHHPKCPCLAAFLR